MRTLYHVDTLTLGHFITQTFEHKKTGNFITNSFFAYFFFCAVKVIQKSGIVVKHILKVLQVVQVTLVT